MIAKQGPTVIACLLVVLAILLAAPLVINPPRRYFFRLWASHRTGQDVPPHYIGPALELDPTQVRAAKERMMSKLEQARALVTLAIEEAQQTEAAISKVSRGVNDEARVWYLDINNIAMMIREADRDVGALGENPSLVQLKKAGQRTNWCIDSASDYEGSMRVTMEDWQRRVGRPTGGV